MRQHCLLHSYLHCTVRERETERQRDMRYIRLPILVSIAQYSNFGQTIQTRRIVDTASHDPKFNDITFFDGRPCGASRPPAETHR